MGEVDLYLLLALYHKNPNNNKQQQKTTNFKQPQSPPKPNTTLTPIPPSTYTQAPSLIM